MVFASGIRKVFGHRFNWGGGGEGSGRGAEGGLQWGTCRLGVTCRGHSNHLPLKPGFSLAFPVTEAGCFLVALAVPLTPAPASRTAWLPPAPPPLVHLALTSVRRPALGLLLCSRLWGAAEEQPVKRAERPGSAWVLSQVEGRGWSQAAWLPPTPQQGTQLVLPQLWPLSGRS